MSTEAQPIPGAVQKFNHVRGCWETIAPPAWPAVTAPAPVERAVLASPALSQTSAARPSRAQVRSYASARPSRFNVGLGSAGNSSGDAELHQALTQLRAASRQVVRDGAYAKRARAIVVNNVIGPGVGMQGQVKTTRDGLFTRVNDDIEAAHSEWSQGLQCHTGGRLHLNDMERLLLGQVFEAGEIFVRMHYRSFGGSRVPLGLEVVEPERVPHEMLPSVNVSPGTEYRLGAEVDEFQRPLAWWIRSRHPGDVRTPASMVDRFERVDARDVFHLAVIDRWPQTRGEPWMHTAIRKLDSMEQYSSAELQAAQADSYHFGTVKSTAPDAGPLPNNPTEQAEGEPPAMQIENGVITYLEPDEEFQYHHPSRPNTAIDPFLRYMLREVAAGMGVSYESLSRDYSQTTYSSGRLAILDDRDLWRTLQQWWLRSFRLPLYKRWLQQAVLGGAVPSIDATQYWLNLRKFEAVKFKPRGWSWVDPTKEVAAYKEAEKAGYISAEDVIAQTANGLDIEDVVDAMKRSQQLFDDAGIKRDTDMRAPKPAAAPPPPDEDEPDGEGDTADANSNNQTTRPARVVALQR